METAFEKINKLVGFRGTKRQIEEIIESYISNNELIIDKTINLFLSEDDNSIDINYMFTIDNEYDFDLFVIETRERIDDETVLYITEITNIN